LVGPMIVDSIVIGYSGCVGVESDWFPTVMLKYGWCYRCKRCHHAKQTSICL